MALYSVKERPLILGCRGVRGLLSVGVGPSTPLGVMPLTTAVASGIVTLDRATNYYETEE